MKISGKQEVMYKGKGNGKVNINSNSKVGDNSKGEGKLTDNLKVRTIKKAPIYVNIRVDMIRKIKIKVSTLLYSTLLYSTLLYSTLHYSALLYSTPHYCKITARTYVP